MADTKLKPCPFCGKAGFAGKHPYHKESYLVCCSSKGYGCPLFPTSGFVGKEDLPKTIKAWNRRTND